VLLIVLVGWSIGAGLHAADSSAGHDVSPGQPQTDPSNPAPVSPKEGSAEKPQTPTVAPEALKLPGDFKLRLPEGAAPAKSLAGIAMAGVLSITFFMLCAIRGLERLVRVRPNAAGYLCCALGGLGLYALMAMRLLEVPPDIVTLKTTRQGDASLVELIVAFARRRAELAGDPYDLGTVAVYDGSVNLFLEGRLEFVARRNPPVLEPLRKSLTIDIRGDAVLFYQEVELLGMPLIVTLIVPVEGRTNALRFGEPAARIGTWTVLPRKLVMALWDNLRGAMAGAVAETKVMDTFNVERISEGFIHLTLRQSGGGGTQ
jgi:hypothetical protein